MKNVVKFTGRFFAAFAAIVFIFGCKAEVSDSEKDYKGETGSISVSFAEGAEARDSRALMISELKSAKAVVTGFDSKGEKFTKTSGVVALTGGKADSISVTDIPVCKNAAVVVSAYSDDAGTKPLKGCVISARIEKIEGGKNNPIEVKWETSKTGNVYAALIEVGVNTNTLNDAQISSMNDAIPTDVHASLINADAIAAAAKEFVEGTGTLGAASSYKLTAGSVKVTCNDYNGMTLQITDPLSSVATASTSGAVTISNVAPGTWTLYVLDGTTVKTSMSVTVTGGEETAVSVGSTVVTDRIIVHVAETSNSTYNSAQYSHIWVWATSGSTKYCTNDTWPGDALSDSDNDGWYDYTIKNGESFVTSSMVILSKDGSPQTSNLTISEAGEYWWNGSAFATENPDIPPEPVAPTVSISPSDGSKIALNGSITVTYDDGNDTITSAKVTINSTEYNMGTTAGTFSKKLSEIGITSEGVTVTVSASVTNGAGTGTASAILTTKAASKLVTNPNELRIYQVMVSSFQDGDSSIGYTTAYGPSGALTGGDLQGIINAVDYIKDLGFNALWMTPIFQSAGNSQLDSTGYFCSDYFNVDNHFGTNDKLEELITLFHNKGIAVILDGVFGHHGGSVANSPSGYNVSGKNPVYYTNEGTRNFYKEVAAYWIKKYKIDGWRLDQCYQVGLGETGNGDGDNCQTGGHNYWYDIRLVVADAASSNGTKGTDWGTLGYMVGEHWKGDAALIQKGSINPGSASGYGLQSCFDFPSRYRIINALAKAESDAGGESLGSNLSYVYKTPDQKGYTHPDGYIPNLFVTNHDLVRLGNLIQWKHKETPSSENYWKRHKLALAIVAAYTGPITIYYGDEWGAYVDGYTGPGALGAYNDNAARSTGKISGFNSNEKNLHDYAASLMEMRSSHEALWNGTNTDISTSGDCYVGKKVGGGETIYYAINNGTSSTSFSASGTDLLSGQTYSGTVTVPALSAVYVLEN